MFQTVVPTASFLGIQSYMASKADATFRYDELEVRFQFYRRLLYLYFLRLLLEGETK